jgi:drug/metabolite transporter (DMT)-like permease
MPRPTLHLMGLALVVTADLLWSTVFVTSQIGLEYTNPYNLVFMRFLFSSIPILAVAVFYGPRLGLKGELSNRWTWLLGAIYAMGFLFQYMGQDMTSASDATLLSNLAPILIPFLSALTLRERLTPVHILASAISFVGLYFVAGFNPSATPLSMLGYALLLFTSLAYALFTVMGKKYGSAALGSSLAIILVITAILAPVAIAFGGFGTTPMIMPLYAWLTVLYLAIPCTLFAIIIYLRGLANVGASEAGFLLLLQILVGLILSSTILGDMLEPYQTLGAALIMIGLLIGLAANRRTDQGSKVGQQ